MKSIFSVFKKGLQKTATSVARSVGGLVSDVKVWDASTYDDLEAALLAADFGPETTFRLVEEIRDRYQRGLIKTSEDVNTIIREDIVKVLEKNGRPIAYNPSGPTVILMVGVNGSGKTTTAGKLAAKWTSEGRKVTLAACDTFRAAAV
jgi:fused signal recognition particle receptor